MADDIAVLRAIYNCFNARDIDGVLDALTDDVAWASWGLTRFLKIRSDLPVGLICRSSMVRI
jgi:hypothetical protein